MINTLNSNANVAARRRAENRLARRSEVTAQVVQQVAVFRSQESVFPGSQVNETWQTIRKEVELTTCIRSSTCLVCKRSKSTFFSHLRVYFKNYTEWQQERWLGKRYTIILYACAILFHSELQIVRYLSFHTLNWHRFALRCFSQGRGRRSAQQCVIASRNLSGFVNVLKTC